MPEKFNTDASLTPKNLAKHLKQPEGETGKKVGYMMNKGNKHICLNTYEVLNPNDNDQILEIGMGNGFFVKDLLSKADNLSYTGADFSPTMVKEAQEINIELVKSGSVNFIEASIEKLPFYNNSFHSITTTNTLYFWPNPQANLKELLRILKPDGKLVIGYRGKEFMENIEISKHGFTKYRNEEVEKLLSQNGFKDVKTIEINEPDLEFDGKNHEMIGIFTSGIKTR